MMQRAKLVHHYRRHTTSITNQNNNIIQLFNKCIIKNTYTTGAPCSSSSLEEAQDNDQNRKLLLSANSYYGDQGKPFVFKTVREAERRLHEYNLNHECSPAQGVASFCESSRQLVFGSNSQAVREGRIATVQTLGGTGALRLAAELLLSSSTPNESVKQPTVYFPSDAHSHHKALFRAANFQDIQSYRSYDTSKLSMDLKGFLEDLNAAPKRSIIVLNANNGSFRTGAEFTTESWNQIAKVCKERQHTVVLYNSQQGILSGDLNQDAQPIRSLVDAGGISLLVCQSNAVNFGLYGESVGALHIVCDSKTEASNVQMQMQNQAKLHYTCPPAYGARLVSIVLADPELKKQWEAELMAMSSRIRHMREGLVYRIVNAGSKKHWNHITNQSGMFSHSGLSEEQVKQLMNEHHIYLHKDGCFNVARLNSTNIDYVANAFHQVTARKE